MRGGRNRERGMEEWRRGEVTEERNKWRGELKDKDGKREIIDGDRKRGQRRGKQQYVRVGNRREGKN